MKAHLVIVGDQSHLSPEQREIVAQAAAGAQKFLDWLNEGETNGRNAQIEKQYREGRMGEYRSFDWYSAL